METIWTGFQMFSNMAWISQASYWQLPPKEVAPSSRDAYMLGGMGLLSARMGMQAEYATIDRIMGPEFDSYGYYQNNYFRRSQAGVSVQWPHMRTSWISIEWPGAYHRPQQKLWRVPTTTIVCTWEQQQASDERGVWLSGVELMTINFIHSEQPALLRVLALRNGGIHPIQGIRIVVDAPPDITWPDVGHNSQIQPFGERLLENVTEYELESGKDQSRKNSDSVQRHRICLRGLIGGERRGTQHLAGPPVNLEPGEETASLAYIAVSPDGTVSGAEAVEGLLLDEFAQGGLLMSLERTYENWQHWNAGRLNLHSPDPQVDDFIDAAVVAQKQAQHHSGGIMVGDDYTSSFVRDCNGSHLLLGAAGHIDEELRSMDFFYRMDLLSGNFHNSYLLDLKAPSLGSGDPLWWETALASQQISGGGWNIDNDQVKLARNKVMTPGDVPNFRVLWYWWHHLRTGDLKLVDARWSYLSALIRLQNFEAFEFLNGFSGDETYGIGPVGELRSGASADNSFIALAAVEAMANLAQRLQKHNDAREYTVLASQIREAVEAHFWMEEAGYYAMRRIPGGGQDDRPCSPGLLRPLWIGCQGLEPNRLASSVDFVLDHLYHAPGFLRIIPSDFWMTCGHFPGYLLVNLCKLEHPLVERAFTDLLSYINPGGTCAEYYEYASPVPRADIHRSRNWETGINADAVLFYLTGFEPDAWAGTIRLRPHLPRSWERLDVRGMPVGSSQLDLVLERQGSQLIYRINLRGSQEFRIYLRGTLPLGWGDGIARVNGQPVKTQPECNRYGTHILPVEFDLPAGRAAEVCLTSASEG